MEHFSKKIMDIMDTIEYGFKNKIGENIYNLGDVEWNKFYEFYYLQTPDELLQSKCGICWDQVELERKMFNEYDVKVKTYFIYGIDGMDLPSHTFLVYENEEIYYWFEHSWGIYRGIHAYKSLKLLLGDVKEKFMSSNLLKESINDIYLYEYNMPPIHIGCDEFYKYIETQKEIKID